ncbi:MAG: hypothetical protein ACRDMV_05060 [Streptosporangiales bacterium]
MLKPDVAFHWSGGKDSALALSVLLAQGGDVTVDRLVTTVDAERNTSTVHGLPVELLQAQARNIGIPLQAIALPGPGLDGYVDAINAAAVRMRHEGIDAFVFGDLSCSNVRHHKERQFGPLGIEVLEPLWDMTSRECIERFLESGIRAVTVVVDAGVLTIDEVGVPVNREFIDRLPENADPCGEFGEYHSFAYDGPIFRAPVDFSLSSPRRYESDIRTTEGVRRYAYWLATPQPPRSC